MLCDKACFRATGPQLSILNYFCNAHSYIHFLYIIVLFVSICGDPLIEPMCGIVFLLVATLMLYSLICHFFVYFIICLYSHCLRSRSLNLLFKSCISSKLLCQPQVMPHPQFGRNGLSLWLFKTIAQITTIGFQCFKVCNLYTK